MVLEVNIDNRILIRYRINPIAVVCLHYRQMVQHLWFYLNISIMYQGPYSPPFIFSKLMNGPNKLECYITIGWKGLAVTNTLAYWVHS